MGKLAVVLGQMEKATDVLCLTAAESSGVPGGKSGNDQVREVHERGLG